MGTEHPKPATWEAETHTQTHIQMCHAHVDACKLRLCTHASPVKRARGPASRVRRFGFGLRKVRGKRGSLHHCLRARTISPDL